MYAYCINGCLVSKEKTFALISGSETVRLATFSFKSWRESSASDLSSKLNTLSSSIDDSDNPLSSKVSSMELSSSSRSMLEGNGVVEVRAATEERGGR